MIRCCGLPFPKLKINSVVRVAIMVSGFLTAGFSPAWYRNGSCT